MTRTLVDTCILIDVATKDPTWYEWSSTKLAERADSGQLYINPIIYAEASIEYSDIADFERAVPQDTFRRLNISSEAAFLAGKAFVEYKQRGGSRRSPLPDFFIGAHAAVAGLDLLTRDAARYRSYFPTVTLVSP